MVIIKLFLFTLFISNITAPYTTLGWNSCSTAAQVPKVKIERISMLPMPIKNPGVLTLDIGIVLWERIQGRLPTSVQVIRTVAGLVLPITCYSAYGFFFSSCSYQDLCKDIVQDYFELNPSNCPPELQDYGFDCNCPFNIPAQTIDPPAQTFDIPNLSTSVVSVFANGDFEFRITVNNAANQHIACFRFLYTLIKGNEDWN